MSYRRARVPFRFETPVSFAARDPFTQAAGNLHGKSLAAGGTWDTDDQTVPDDFTIDTATQAAQNASVNDGGITGNPQNGRFAKAGTAAFTNVIVQVDFEADAFAGPSNGIDSDLGHAVFARYTNLSNFFTPVIGAGADERLRMTVFKEAGGTLSYASPLNVVVGSWSLDSPTSVRLQADTQGRWVTWVWPSGGIPSSPALWGQDSDLATGGALASGVGGILDGLRDVIPVTRKYRNFFIAVPLLDAVVHSGQSARFLHDTALRENAAGTSEGRVPVFEGKHLTLPPATRAGYKSRLVVKSRRLDVDSGLPDQGLSDSLAGTLTVTPRVVLLSK